MAEEVVPEREEVLRPAEDNNQPIKHLSWDMFGRQIIALFASGVVKSYSWKYGRNFVVFNDCLRSSILISTVHLLFQT